MMSPPVQGSISGADDGAVVALAIVNTILGASTGGLAVLFINKFMFAKPWSFLNTLNGALAGMVALCAGGGRVIILFYTVYTSAILDNIFIVPHSSGCNVYEPWAALLVGAGGGVGFIAVHHAMIRFKLDDPLGETNMIMSLMILTSCLQMRWLCTGRGEWWVCCQSPGLCTQVSIPPW